MRMSIVAAVGAAVMVATWSTPASAKNLAGQAGVGYENTLPGSPTSGLGGSAISARYWTNDQVFIGGLLGMATFDPDADGADSESNFGIGVNGGYAFAQEQNMNVFFTGGLTFGSVAVTTPGGGGDPPETEGKSTLGLNLGVGAEFFFQGLPNLGFSTAFGLSYMSIDDIGSSITLGGGDFATFGIRYYWGGPKGG